VPRMLAGGIVLATDGRHENIVARDALLYVPFAERTLICMA
jgi:hypothetical protein